nr:sigma factor-like helix-turn-helix DNA-binding protein [Paenibacillus glacialis]
MHSFDSGKNSFKQWLAAIAKYKAIDYQRKQIAIHNQQFSVSEMDELKLQANQPSETICVDELLEQLSATEREIFEKYYLEGTPSSEIAAEFNANLRSDQRSSETYQPD